MGAADAPLAIVVHGGAWTIPTDQRAAHRAGCTAAAEAGWHVLQSGGSALDAVEYAIRVMEDNPDLNAGTGAVLTAEGRAELDAGLMDGATLRVGAVTTLRHYTNPIHVARRVLERTDHHLLVGPGAEAFAAAQGFETVPEEALVVPRERARHDAWRAGREREADFAPSDTVGAVALDAQGHLAAGNSTGGTSFSLAGRVGDAPLPGLGYYADDRSGAVACTGMGEHIMRVGLALRVIQRLEAGATAAEAARAAIALLQARVDGGQAGLIVVDAQGRVGLAHSTPYLAFAYRTTATDEIISGVEAGDGAASGR